MDLKKEYYSEGIKYNILEMVKREPEWAANRLQEGEKHFEELQELRNAAQQVDAADSKACPLYVDYRKSCKALQRRKAFLASQGGKE
ncbi:MAG: hypothetical protein KAV87_68650 [Desulfobacteraceae bacterium]|nr:hypothetical protein [Desulfobacteraceae bacterium]